MEETKIEEDKPMSRLDTVRMVVITEAVIAAEIGKPVFDWLAK